MRIIMREQGVGVETFDPDVALYALNAVLTETDAELWSERFRAAAFGAYSALAGESPPDTSEYEKVLLEQTQHFTCEQLSLFVEQNLTVLIFDPETSGWYKIVGVGYNTELLSLVAQVHDPQDPNSIVTKLLGPSTELACVDTAGNDASSDWLPYSEPIPDLYPKALNFIELAVHT